MGKPTRRALLMGTAATGAAAMFGGALMTATRARPRAQTGQATPWAAQATPMATPAASPAAHAPASTESWTEPWIWRPSEWPGQRLDLNVVENENPGAIVGFGNQTAVLFSYGGGTPGPTIRMRGDEDLLVTLRNLLGQNFGASPIGPYPDPISYELPPNVTIEQVNAKARQLGLIRDDVCLGEHTNGFHAIHDTNLHTHGLHVRPGRNPDGTESDNIFLRLISRQDFLAREAQAASPSCQWLRDLEQTGFLQDDETVGFQDFDFHVGDVQASTRARLGLPPQPHPPGTFWYHPHCHGATHLQVASGMAGFLIIEGDVDEAINLALTGSRIPDPQTKTGPYDYIERTMLIQRVFTISQDPDAPTQTLEEAPLVPGAHAQSHDGGAPHPVVNGERNPATIVMRPGALERWRLLNGSVDGQGYIQFMVVKGHYAVEQRQPFDDPEATSVFAQEPAPTLVKLRDPATNTFTPATRAEVEADKQRLYLLALDGITLVDMEGDNPVYAIRDLAAQNSGTENPLDRELTGHANPNLAMLDNLQACFKDALSIKNAFVRPNEVLFAQGNRADVLFQAPRLDTAANRTATSETCKFTVLARLAVLNTDEYQSALQEFGTEAYHRDTLVALQGGDTVVAYVVVSEGAHDEGATPAPIPDFDVLDLNTVMPPVAEYHRPITDDELRIKAAEGDTPADPDAALPERVGKFRTRTIAYSGWGGGRFPLITTVGDSETAQNFRAFVERDQANGGELELLRYAEIADNTGEYLLLPPAIDTMAISTSLSDDVIDDSDPLFPITAGTARKFSPDDPRRPQMLLETAEEWAVSNYSITLWADRAAQTPGQYGLRFPGQPLLRAEGHAKFAAQPEDGKTFQVQALALDHPFHIHTNPVWVTRVEVPDEQGNLVNILDKPEWRDVAWLPRNGGRVVFRTRFPDYVGTFVNHCHILIHEDFGMMQAVEITPYADHANYELREQVASSSDTVEAVTAIYPRLNQSEAYVQSLYFVDPNHASGQTYPGFVAGPPSGS